MSTQESSSDTSPSLDKSAAGPQSSPRSSDAQSSEPPLLRLQGITKNFGPVQALVDVTFDIPVGKVTSLAGDNGAGKSVLIKTIAGIHPPDGGQLLWEGKPVHFHTPKDAAAVGIETVYQDLALCDNLDIVQNMFLGRERTRRRLLDEESMEISARETLKSLAVTTVRSVRQPVASLSGGQRQSVAIAKAVLWNSKLVIMDEPTAALGVSQTEMVLALVRRLADRGLGVLLVSHNMNDVFQVADRIAVLNLGRLVGVHDIKDVDRQIVVDLMTSGHSTRLKTPRRVGNFNGWSVAMAMTENVQSGSPSDGPSDNQIVKEAAQAAEAAALKAQLAAGAPIGSSFGDYARATLSRVRSGESGVLPVVGGLLLISILFQSLNSKFLSAGNLVNLLVQGAAYMLFAMGAIFVLLLGEIDLSIGYVGGVGGVVTAELLKQSIGWSWELSVLVGLVACIAIGTFQGTIITRIGLPSFVVTLAGQLGWLALMLFILGSGGVVPINSNIINDIASGQLTPVASWIVLIVIAAGYGAMTWFRDSRRRKSGLVAPPASISILKIAAVAVAGIVIVLVCNTNRGVGFVSIKGVPWVMLLVLAALAFNTVLLGRTRFGRYVYAIGGNAEAARRGGVSIAWIRTACFALASFMAGLGGIVYASRLRSVSTSFDGGTLVLYAIAAAVIGGTSLFGGRGKPLHAVLGGLVIAAIFNGMGLQGYSAPAQYAVTALVLLAAVVIDALAHRGSTARR